MPFSELYEILEVPQKLITFLDRFSMLNGDYDGDRNLSFWNFSQRLHILNLGFAID
jgi:hypothetical protein